MADATQAQNLSARKPLTQEALKAILHYDPETGAFTWLVDQGRAKRGSITGVRPASRDDGRPAIIKIHGKLYRAHRLAFLYMTGRWPAELVDHIDCDPSNNRWDNLREANKSQNAANSRQRTGVKSKRKGAFFHKRTRKWRSQIGINGKQIFIGTFNSEESAWAAYCTKARELFGKFARPM